ncbi:MAG: helix-hairpin-helix domain-containing protein [Patescibacteria group bacterium]
MLYSLLGLILIGFGLLAYKTDIFSTGDKVEVLQTATEAQDSDKEIVVEISGAVTKAGVYKMHLGDRIDDLLIISGGLSENADRDWVTKNINRASKLIDGQKLYIYQTGEVSAKNISGVKEVKGLSNVTEANPTGFININTASLKELEKLVGIGPVYAQNIIEGRSYSTTEELVSKKIISQNLYIKIKNDITAY